VIKHWRVHNYIRNDRYKETAYKEEKQLLELNENNAYTEKNNLGIPNDNQMDTQVRLGKDRIGKDNNNILSTEPVAESKYLVAIIKHLNEKAGTNYRTGTQSTARHINARLKEGFTLDDFFTVIDKKVAEWKGSEMEKYLRPETLFGTKFESYLNAKQTKQLKGANGVLLDDRATDDLDGIL